MSAILSADDLNDFISPGVACIKPVEPLPKAEDANPYEVTTEDQVEAANPAPASISLTDCLACSGCVTSAEAVLVSLQSHAEVLNTLDAHPSADIAQLASYPHGLSPSAPPDAKIFVASVSPQVRASLAATLNISGGDAGRLIEHFLCGPEGLGKGGKHGSRFAFVVDTNRMREAGLYLGAEEVARSRHSGQERPRPVLSSACPGWVCFAEKTHPHIVPHLSRVKSPQALTGTLLKSVLSKSLGIHPSQIWHLAIMPCFDKKLEASREELTDRWWFDSTSHHSPVRDVDCVITPRELISLAADRGISLSCLPLAPMQHQYRPSLLHPPIARFLFPKPRRRPEMTICRDQDAQGQDVAAASMSTGTSGGYVQYILQHYQHQHPGSTIRVQPGRNKDVVEYSLLDAKQQTTLLTCARFYGFRNIQNLVRKLKPTTSSSFGARVPGSMARRKLDGASGKNGLREYAYVEVMACPGGCTNGGGQIRAEEAVEMSRQRAEAIGTSDPAAVEIPAVVSTQRDWLRRVDSAYFSASSVASYIWPPDPSPGRPPTPASLPESATSCAAGLSSESSPASLTASGDTSPQQHQSDSATDPESEPDPRPGSAAPHPTSTDDCPDQARHDPCGEIRALLQSWSSYTSIPIERLAYTDFHAVDSDVGGKRHDLGATGSSGAVDRDKERVAKLAATIDGGW